MRAITVFHRENGQIEEWLTLRADRRLVYHVENGGARCLSRGIEPAEQVLTPEEAIARWPWRAKAITEALPRLELAELVSRLEAAAHDIEGADADLALLQSDLQRLRPVLEGLGIHLEQAAYV
jgi:hypothetical protein